MGPSLLRAEGGYGFWRETLDFQLMLKLFIFVGYETAFNNDNGGIGGCGRVGAVADREIYRIRGRDSWKGGGSVQNRADRDRNGTRTEPVDVRKRNIQMRGILPIGYVRDYMSARGRGTINFPDKETS